MGTDFGRKSVFRSEILARTAIDEGRRKSSRDGAAQEAAQHGALAAKSQNPSIRWQVAIDAAGIEISEKNAGHSASGSTALQKLAAIVAKSRELGYQGIEVEARLAIAEIEMKAGQTSGGSRVKRLKG